MRNTTTMQVTIQKQKYTLQFGFGFLRKLGEIYNLESYQEVMQLLTSKLNSFENISFEQEDVLKNVLIAAAENANSPNQERLKNVDVISLVLQDTKVFEAIITSISASFPKPPGKPTANPTVRKKQKA